MYSTLRVSGTISEGCIFSIEEIEILEKMFFQDIFAEKGMLTKEREKMTNHPHFQHTPVDNKNVLILV